MKNLNQEKIVIISGNNLNVRGFVKFQNKLPIVVIFI